MNRPASDQTADLDYEPDTEEVWLQESDDLPPRRSRKLLTPIPVTLLMILLTACGFFAGVQVEKGHTSSSVGSGLPAGLSALGSRSGSSKSSSSSGAPSTSAGFPGGSFASGGGRSGAGLTTGEVSYVSGNTLYVNNSEGNTIKVKVPAGTKVSKTVSASVHGVHPGETVIVTGSEGKNGSITASSISVSSSSGSSASGASGSSGSESTQQLFGAG